MGAALKLVHQEDQTSDHIQTGKLSDIINGSHKKSIVRTKLDTSTVDLTSFGSYIIGPMG